MYSYVRTGGIPAVVVREAPACGVAFIIAELFYKFYSFAPETAAFLVTWYVLSGLQSQITGARDT
jgi:hypothetical protein